MRRELSGYVAHRYFFPLSWGDCFLFSPLKVVFCYLLLNTSSGFSLKNPVGQELVTSEAKDSGILSLV